MRAADPMHTAEPRRFQCRHIFVDGRRCGSPCLRGQDFCFYHHTARRPGPRQPQVKTLADRRSSTFALPTPADLAERSGIQLALGQVLHKIAHNELDPRRAGLLLYGLQIASTVLGRDGKKPATAAHDPVEEISADPEFGPLAPQADFEREEPAHPGTVQALLERLEREGEQSDALEESRRQAGLAEELRRHEDARGALEAERKAWEAERTAWEAERKACEAERQALEAARGGGAASIPSLQAAAEAASSRRLSHPGSAPGTRDREGRCRYRLGDCPHPDRATHPREKISLMTDQPDQPAKPALPTRKTGLSPAQQKLQAALEKAAHAKTGAKPVAGASNASFRAKSSFAGKKTAFQRKAT